MEHVSATKIDHWQVENNIDKVCLCFILFGVKNKNHRLIILNKFPKIHILWNRSAQIS